MLLNDRNERQSGDSTTDLSVNQLIDALEASKLQAHVAQEKVSALTQVNDSLRDELLAQEAKLANAQLLAYYDQLTGLPNRSLLQDRFRLALANAIRYHRRPALLFLDLNDFKQMNDEHGHAVGDKLLQRVATRLACSLRAVDTACRYGGDEFVVLLSDVETPSGAVDVASKIGKTLSLPYHIEQKKLQLTVSIGIARYPTDGDNLSELIRKADLAMYHVKNNGRPPEIEVIALDSGYGLTKKKSRNVAYRREAGR